MDNQRSFLLVVLAAIVLMIWFQWDKAQRSAQPAAPISTQPSAQYRDGTPTVPRPPSAQYQPAAPSAPSPPSKEDVASKILPGLDRGRRIHVTTDLLEVEIDTQGGDLRYLGLRKHPTTLDETAEPFPLMQDSGKDIFIAQAGLVGKGHQYPYHRTRYRAEKLTYTLEPGQEQLVVDIHWRAPDRTEYIKRHIFSRDSYVIRTEFLVHNRSNRTWSGFLYSQFFRQPPEDDSGFTSLPTFSGGAIYTTEDRYEKIKFSEMAESPLQREVTGGWVAVIQHYFVGAWMPAAKQRGQIYTNSPGKDRYVIGYKNLTPLTLTPGQRGKVGTDLYAGPKENKRLSKLIEGMVLTIDFGWLTFLSSPLFWLLATIHGLIGNWGWAIIVLTILIKMVFYPLNNVSFKSMARMKKLGPRLKALKEQYGDDRERYGKEMMALYKKEKVNPMSSCLPMLLQIPVFIALYWALLESVEMRQAPFMLWIHDLSARDPYFVLPVLMGASMFVTSWMSPATDPMQRRLFLAMPVMFTVFFLFFPSGLVLYWLVNNVLQIIQQTIINRSMAAKK